MRMALVLAAGAVVGFTGWRVASSDVGERRADRAVDRRVGRRGRRRSLPRRTLPTGRARRAAVAIPARRVRWRDGARVRALDPAGGARGTGVRREPRGVRRGRTGRRDHELPCGRIGLRLRRRDRARVGDRAVSSAGDRAARLRRLPLSGVQLRGSGSSTSTSRWPRTRSFRTLRRARTDMLGCGPRARRLERTQSPGFRRRRLRDRSPSKAPARVSTSGSAGSTRGRLRAGGT